MSDPAAQPVLRRKLAPPRPSRVPGQGALQQMLAKTMPRDADKLLGLQIAVTGIETGEARKAEVIGALRPSDLVYLMKADRMAPGLCMVAPALLSGLIEMQVSGRVSGADPGNRMPTRTDGIVASDIVDRWIASAKSEAAAQDILDRLPFSEHYRAGTVADARYADLALDSGHFRTLKVTLDLSGGVKTGTISFALPVHVTGKVGMAGGTAQQFRQVIREVETQLSVVLARLPRTLEQARRLAVGDTLEIPIEALGRVGLETVDGNRVATARLGQSGGQKAVRILGRGAVEAATPPSKTRSEFLGVSVPGDRGMPGSLALPSGMPDEDDLPDLPELPDFPELPDLPDLPELPNFPD